MLCGVIFTIRILPPYIDINSRYINVVVNVGVDDDVSVNVNGDNVNVDVDSGVDVNNGDKVYILQLLLLIGDGMKAKIIRNALEKLTGMYDIVYDEEEFKDIFGDKWKDVRREDEEIIDRGVVVGAANIRALYTEDGDMKNLWKEIFVTSGISDEEIETIKRLAKKKPYASTCFNKEALRELVELLDIIDDDDSVRVSLIKEKDDFILRISGSKMSVLLTPQKKEYCPKYP